MSDWLDSLRQRDPARARAFERRQKRYEAEERRAEARRPIADADADAMLACPMRAPSVIGLTKTEVLKQRVCFMCGKVQPPRRQFWCSDECVREWTRNHEWSAASFAARARDNHRCARCGAEGEHYTHASGWVGTPGVITEVNHIDPRSGRGYHQGCHHHLDLLETLCHGCHVTETNQQAAQRRAAQRLADEQARESA